MRNDFEWELGYMLTASNNTGKGIAKDVARMLVEKFSKGNLMASTEVSDNLGMASILKQLGFCRDGKTWKSDIHGKDLPRNEMDSHGLLVALKLAA